MRPGRSRALLATSVLGEGSVVLAVQLLPIVFLTIFDYAWYSAIYLGYAAWLAIMLALLSDVWARAASVKVPGARDEYYGVLTTLAFVSAIPTTSIVGVITLDVTVSAAAGVATAFAVYRAGSRYFLIVMGEAGRAGLADLFAGLLGVAISIALIARDAYSLQVVLIIWLGVNCFSVVAMGARPVFNFRHLMRWVPRHRPLIGTLLGEAGLMNLASLGNPVIVGAIAGPAALALLRAATSLIYPVRLIMSAIRPSIVSGQLGRARGAVSAVGAVGAILGVAISAALTLSSRFSLAAGSAAEVLAEYSLAVAALAAATTLSTYFQFVARGALPGKAIIQRRIVHTLVMLSCTTIAAQTLGISAIIWAASVATVITIPLWALRTKGSALTCESSDTRAQDTR